MGGFIKVTAKCKTDSASVDTEVVHPEILSSYWADAKKNKITKARLGQKVYFIIKTRGFRRGQCIELKLFEEDVFSDDDMNTLKSIPVNTAGDTVVELDLPESWDEDIEDDGLGQIELYWRATFDNKKVYLPDDDDDYLDVLHSDMKLYVKPSNFDDGVPELYSCEGEVLSVLTQESLETAADALHNSAGKAVNRFVLAKLEKGYLIDNTGRVYTPTTARGTNRQIVNKTDYMNDGTRLLTRRGRDITFAGTDGNIITTKGISQYGSFARKFKVIGTLKYIDAVWSFFEIIKLGFDTGRDEPLPIPIPGADLLGMMVMERYSELEADYQRTIQIELNEAKMRGLESVREYIRQQHMSDFHYELYAITKETAARILNNEFKSIDEVPILFGKNADDADIEILVRERFKHPVRKDKITIVEAFFYKTIE